MEEEGTKTFEELMQEQSDSNVASSATEEKDVQTEGDQSEQGTAQEEQKGQEQQAEEQQAEEQQGEEEEEEPKGEKEEQIKNLNAALSESRESIRQLKEQSQQLRSELDQQRMVQQQQINQQQQQQQQQQEPQYEDDDFVTHGQLKDFVEKQVTPQISQNIQPIEAEMMNHSETIARQQYENYDEVVAPIKQAIRNGDRRVYDYIKGGQGQLMNAGERAYRLGLAMKNDQLKQQNEQQKTQQQVQQIDKNRQRQKPSSMNRKSSGSTQGGVNKKAFGNMSYEQAKQLKPGELEKLWEKEFG